MQKKEHLTPQSPAQPRARIGSLGHWMEEVIREAQQRGDFDRLPGRGRPLSLQDTDPFAGEDAAGYKILKEAGFTPEWIELRSQIAAQICWLRANAGHPERPSRIVEVNVLIDKHNRSIPNPSLAYPKVPRNFPVQ